MATIGLKGIWGLEQLDRTGIATWKLGVLLMGGGALFGSLLLMMLYPQDQESRLGFPPNVIATMIVMTCALIGAYLFITLFFSRATEADLRLLVSLDSQVEESIVLLKPSRTSLLIFMVVCLLVAVINILGPIFLLHPEMTVKQILGDFGSSKTNIVLFYLLLPLFGVIAGPLLCTLFMQCKSLTNAARRINIDLFKLLRYSTIANPLVKIVIFVVSLVAFLQLAVVFVGLPEFTRYVLVVLLILFLISIPIFTLFGYPVIILRNRIKEKKEEEMMKIAQALEQAEAESDPNNSSIDLSLANTVTYQMFVESRWEWPIASHVQKLILFGLLPPVAWVLAATIEYALYG